MHITGTMRSLDTTHGVVRVEELYDTGIEDLWQACTKPERLARWIAEVSGDLQVGGTIHTVFTSTFSGPGRIDVCEAPHHLLVTMDPDTDDQTQIEAWLTPDGSQTRLVVEDRGMPLGRIYFHGAGWQAHLEDLTRSLVGEAPPQRWTASCAAPAWRSRWTELTPIYQQQPVR